MFDDFRIARYELVLEAGQQGLNLPVYKGSTLRGGFGNVFRRICCSQPTGQCSNCLVNQTCPYARIFEPSPPPDAVVLKKYSNIPRPFVIEPPLEEKTVYQPGEQLTFGLVLIGQAIAYLPYFVLAFKELGQIGLGKGRLPYTLREVRACLFGRGEDAAVYQAGHNRVLLVDNAVTLAELLQLSVNQRQCGIGHVISIDFCTPTRLKYDQALVSDLDFHVLIRNLLRRISTLYYFYHDQEPGSENVDYRELTEAANEIKTTASKLQLMDWERYSHRQDARVNMAGLVGEVSYEGKIEPFWPILVLGELIHVGKGCVFGLGKFEIKRR